VILADILWLNFKQDLKISMTASFGGNFRNSFYGNICWNFGRNFRCNFCRNFCLNFSLKCYPQFLPLFSISYNLVGFVIDGTLKRSSQSKMSFAKSLCKEKEPRKGLIVYDLTSASPVLKTEYISKLLFPHKLTYWWIVYKVVLESKLWI